MFNIGLGEMLVILLIAFLVVGPKDLPKVVVGIKSFLKMARKLIRDLKEESGWNEIVKEITDTKDEVVQEADKLNVVKEVKNLGKDLRADLEELDPRKDIEQAGKDVLKEAESTRKELQSAGKSLNGSGATPAVSTEKKGDTVS